MVHKKVIAGIAVAAGSLLTLAVGRELLKNDGNVEPIPPDQLPLPGQPNPPAGSLGSVFIEIENVEQFAQDLFIFDTRYNNLSSEEQTFEAIMQIADPRNTVQTIKTTKITIPGLSSRTVRFSTGNLFKLALLRGIWRATFFAWESLDLPIPFADDVIHEFTVDVL